jgi:hypothetical protein
MTGRPTAWRLDLCAALVLAVFAVVSFGIVPDGARAATITTNGLMVQRIGPLSVLGRHGYIRNYKPADAERVFGPARVLVEEPARCELFWERWHLTLDYENYGVRTGYGCNDTFLMSGYARGTWRTGRGLRIGSTVAMLKGLYPRARWNAHARWWSLLPYWSPAGAYYASPISAIARNGRVIELEFDWNPAGE